MRWKGATISIFEATRQLLVDDMLVHCLSMVLQEKVTFRIDEKCQCPPSLLICRELAETPTQVDAVFLPILLNRYHSNEAVYLTSHEQIEQTIGKYSRITYPKLHKPYM